MKDQVSDIIEAILLIVFAAAVLKTITQLIN